MTLPLTSGKGFKGLTILTAKLFLLISSHDGYVLSFNEYPLVIVFVGVLCTCNVEKWGLP